ncbi:MAG: C-GCAxxG-C-C family protein [Rhodospirillales bacterium]|nr:C-GCAxxG-C-C family protein [Rhodospirillales bacterium]
MTEEAKNTALAHFNGGLFCAESVLLALAQHQEIESDLLPAISTGFCSGQARTCGQCGAVAGALMGLGLAFGRNRGGESLDQAYQAVQNFLKAFESEFGSSNCQGLLGVDLGTAEGYAEFKDKNLIVRCIDYVAKATEMAAEIIDKGNGTVK